MKQLLFLLLFPCLAMAQYQGNGNQKITLGEQSTADGLVYRGVENDTALITPFSDTSAYIILDTINNKFYNYNRSTNVWSLAGGGGGGGGTGTVTSITAGTGLTGGTITTSGTLAADTNFLVTRFDTASMLLPYWQSGRFSGVLPVANGGTGSATQNFVDLSTNQTVNGIKTFKDSLFLGNVVVGKTKQNNNSVRFGINAGLSTADKNVAIGTDALQNDIGGENVAIGFEAGKRLTTGVRNMLLGSNAGSKLTTGGSNVAFGGTALFNMVTGGANVAVGRAAMEQSTIAFFNTAMGNSALYSTEGDYNTAVGNNAGWANSVNKNTTGTNNTFIGNEAVGASSTASNVITLGNSSIATIRAQVTTITSLSDMRDKTDILPLNYGMNFIDKLKPVSFVWDMRDGGKIGIPEIGFIAQDLQKAQIDTGINIPNLVSGVEEKLEASYGVLLPIIVKALQEANEKIKSLEQRIINLENK